jgi:hypothetical protein
VVQHTVFIVQYYFKAESWFAGHISKLQFSKQIDISSKFLALQIDNHLNWKNHTNLMISKLSRAR